MLRDKPGCKTDWEFLYDLVTELRFFCPSRASVLSAYNVGNHKLLFLSMRFVFLFSASMLPQSHSPCQGMPNRVRQQNSERNMRKTNEIHEIHEIHC